jgi:hypothetical protein
MPDVARAEARKLQIEDELFAHLVERMAEELREHERYLREQGGAPLVLHAHDSQLYSVENDRTGLQATVAFDGLQHIIEIRGKRIHYTFEVIISDKGSPSFTMRKDGELVPGTVTQAKMLTALHLAIDSITDLHAPTTLLGPRQHR